MKVYISGPIAGLPELSRAEKLLRFARAEVILRGMGHEPFNPVVVEACPDGSCQVVKEHWPDGTFKHSWDCWLRYDLIFMLENCDALAVLPGWETSMGAKLERHIAEALGWIVIDLSGNTEITIRTNH